MAQGTAEQARAVIDSWLRAFLAADVDAIAALYALDATFFGTSGQAIVLDHAGIRAYFERALSWARPVRAVLLEESVRVLVPGMAVVCALDEVAWDDAGRTVASPGRVSFVLRHAGGAWQIVHFHRSALPTTGN